jgi:cupin fold WbuC family metalloprotein
MRFRQLNDEVLVPDTSLVTVSRADIEELKTRAARSPRRRSRICAHRGDEDKLHEMLIVLARDSYIRPHKHLNRSESFHLIEGTVDVVFFDDDGRVTDVVALGDYASGRQIYYRNDQPRYHTLLIKSEFLVIHETTNGPFRPAETVFASWSPEETDLAGRQQFMKDLLETVRKT